jgi:hypothetical protein
MSNCQLLHVKLLNSVSAVMRAHHAQSRLWVNLHARLAMLASAPALLNLAQRPYRLVCAPVRLMDFTSSS